MSFSPVVAKHHAVQFYQDDADLIKTASDFLSEGLKGQQPALLVATPEHRRALLERLTTNGIDIDEAQDRFDFVVLDAEETLSRFMHEGMPDGVAFDATVGSVVGHILSTRPNTVLRALGEMVDLLWKRRETEAAVRLEMLWNNLAMRHGVALLCGYAMGNFYKETVQFQEVCRQHSHIVEPGARLAMLEATLAEKIV